MPPIEQEIRQSAFRSAEQKAFINIAYTANWLMARQNRFLREFGVSAQQFNILRILRGQAGKPASLGLLRERMLDPMSDVSRLVERLREAGLVERHICPNDRRAADVLITPEGLAVLERIDERSKEQDELLQALDPEELRFLSYLLDKVRQTDNKKEKK